MGKCGRRLVILVLAGTLMLSVQLPAAAATTTDPVRTTGDVLPFDPNWPVEQEPTWVSMKREGRVAPGVDARPPQAGPIGIRRLSAPPLALTLRTGDTGRFVEPAGIGRDDNARNYVDANYWNICSAGAAAVAAAYFIPEPLRLTGAFREPYGPYATTTHWKAVDRDSNLGFTAKARAYMLFMAMLVRPPSFDTPGIDNFSTYPTHGGSPQGIRDAVNWEISGHRSGGRWATYFYFTQENTGPSFSAVQMNRDIVADVAGSGAPVIAAVDADYLPNWPDLSRPLHHAITIVGYDNVKDTYTYLDTCGRQCGSTTNGGTHEIAQARLFRAIRMVGRADASGHLITRPDGTPRYPTGAYIW